MTNREPWRVSTKNGLDSDADADFACPLSDREREDSVGRSALLPVPHNCS